MAARDPLTRHACQRMSARRIPLAAIDAALCHGRARHVRGALILILGWREVAAAARHGLDLRPFAGVQVICTPDGCSVLTVYRNHDLRGLKPRRRSRRKPHRSPR